MWSEVQLERYLTRSQNGACALVFRAYTSRRITKQAALAAYAEIARNDDAHAEQLIAELRRMIGGPRNATETAWIQALRDISEQKMVEASRLEEEEVPSLTQ